MLDDVIVMLILWRHQNATAKSRRFSRVFAEYLENCSTDFHQRYDIFRQSSIVSFEIKSEDRSFNVAMVINSWESAGLKIMI